MFCEGRLRLGRAAVEVDEGAGYERPLLSLATRVATSIDGVRLDGGEGNGCCRSCTRDMAIQKKPRAFLSKDVTGRRLLSVKELST